MTINKFATVATSIYIVAIALGPVYFLSQSCHRERWHEMAFLPLVGEWFNCHLTPWDKHEWSPGAYGSWLSGAFLPIVIYWAYRTFHETQQSAKAARISNVLAMMPKFHEAFEEMANDIVLSLPPLSIGNSAPPLRGQNPNNTARLEHELNWRLNEPFISDTVEWIRKSQQVENYLRVTEVFIANTKETSLEVYRRGSWYKADQMLRNKQV